MERLMLTGWILMSLACGGEPTVSLTPARRAEIRHFVKQDCGSCHGLILKGGLGKALRPEDLKDKPDEYLRVVIREGIPKTAMPPWKALLTDPEIEEVIRLLRSGALTRGEF